MSGGKGEAMKNESNHVAREIRSDSNRRFLGRLAAFRLDTNVPARFEELLARIDQAERRVD